MGDTSDAPANMQEHTFNFGKHKGRTFQFVYMSDKGYVNWVRTLDKMNDTFKQFIRFCDSRDSGGVLGASSSTRSMASPPAAASRSSFGSDSTPENRKRAGDTENTGEKKRQRIGEEIDEEAECDKCFSTDLPFPGAYRCGACWRKFFKPAENNFYLRSTFADKDLVKSRGARWDGEKRKWYVPAGKDISVFEKWQVVCTKCNEPLSDFKLPSVPVCRGECKIDKEKREDAARREREQKEMEELARAKSEEAEKRREQLKKRIKQEFADFIIEQARKTQAMMEERNAEARDKEQTFMPFVLIAGGLENHASNRLQAGCDYNPFSRSDPESLPDEVTEWMRSIGGTSFSRSSLVFHVEYSPTKILDWAVTFHQKFIDDWMVGPAGDMRHYVQKQKSFIELLLLQSLDPVTPDLKISIEDKLHNSYSTGCPDVVGIFGSKILPRIRLTIGDAQFESLTREQKCNWCVLEYMKHRKKYDSVYKETEETTYMRDVLNRIIVQFIESGALLHDEDESDVLYYPASENDQRRMFMLHAPNTKAADLFSLDLVKAAAQKMTEKSNQKVEIPSAAELRRRIFATFRILHWRIARKLAGGNFAIYGKDDGLREADKDSRVGKFKEKHLAYHDMMLSNEWAPRDFCGFDSKRLHSNTELIEMLFIEHLCFSEKDVKKAKKDAQKYIAQVRKQTDKQEKGIKTELKKSGIKSTDLIEC